MSGGGGRGGVGGVQQRRRRGGIEDVVRENSLRTHLSETSERDDPFGNAETHIFQ